MSHLIGAPFQNVHKCQKESRTGIRLPCSKLGFSRAPDSGVRVKGPCDAAVHCFHFYLPALLHTVHTRPILIVWQACSEGCLENLQSLLSRFRHSANSNSTLCSPLPSFPTSIAPLANPTKTDQNCGYSMARLLVGGESWASNESA